MLEACLFLFIIKAVDEILKMMKNTGVLRVYTAKEERLDKREAICK